MENLVPDNVDKFLTTAVPIFVAVVIITVCFLIYRKIGKNASIVLLVIGLVIWVLIAGGDPPPQ